MVDALTDAQRAVLNAARKGTLPQSISRKSTDYPSAAVLVQRGLLSGEVTNAGTEREELVGVHITSSGSSEIDRAVVARARTPAAAQPAARVVVTDVLIPFESMCVLILKIILATALVGLFLGVMLALIGLMFGVFDRPPR